MTLATPKPAPEALPAVDHHTPVPRPWETYKQIVIRLFGTNKTTPNPRIANTWGRREVQRGGNLLDPVRGCTGGKEHCGRGCHGACYSKESSRRMHRLFDIPVSMVLKEHLLRKDLRNLNLGWVRIGVNGQPSADWPLTLKVARICADEGKDVVLTTRFLLVPGHSILKELVDIGVVLHVSMSAIDGDDFLEERLEALREFRKLGGKAVVRLITFKFKPEYAHLQAKQDELYAWGGTVLEQPVRLQGTSPTIKYVDLGDYEPCISHTTGMPNPRWRTAGAQYDGHYCGTKCPTCEIQCLAKYQPSKVQIL